MWVSWDVYINSVIRSVVLVAKLFAWWKICEWCIVAESWESSGSVFSGGCGLVGGVRVGVNWEGSGIFYIRVCWTRIDRVGICLG